LDVIALCLRVRAARDDLALPTRNIARSTASWNVIGNQVVFADATLNEAR
jgi:hypothetical protein